MGGPLEARSRGTPIWVDVRGVPGIAEAREKLNLLRVKRGGPGDVGQGKKDVSSERYSDHSRETQDCLTVSTPTWDLRSANIGLPWALGTCPTGMALPARD